MDNYFWKYMTDKGRKMHIEKGTFLYQHTDDPCEKFIYLLEEGICALTSMTMDGEENIHLYFHPRRLVSFNQHFSSEKPYPASEVRFSIIAKTECTVYQLPLSTFFNMLRTDMDFNQFVMRTLADNYHEVLLHLHWRVEKSAISRLCYLLLEIVQSSRRQNLVPKFFTYAEMAKYLGVHQVTVSRIMTRIKKLGYVKKCPEGLIIENEKALRTLIENESPFKY